jgi:hypothetical protein
MKLEPLLDGMECDLNETVLDNARIRLGADRLHQIKVYCGQTSAKAARQCQAVHGFNLVVVPDALLPGRYAWAVEFAGRLIGSKGCD